MIGHELCKSLRTEGIAQGIVWLGVGRVKGMGYVGPLCSCCSMLANALWGGKSILCVYGMCLALLFYWYNLLVCSIM